MGRHGSEFLFSLCNRRCPVLLGQHLLEAATKDGLDKVEKEVEIQKRSSDNRSPIGRLIDLEPKDRMRVWLRTAWALIVTCTLLLSLAIAQQGDGPILKPNKPPAKSSMATLLVICDLACNWKLDGEAKGHIDAGSSAKAKVELGQHLVVATTEDGADLVKQLSEVKGAGQTVVDLELQPIRNARLKAEQEAARQREQAAAAERQQEAAAARQREQEAAASRQQESTVWRRLADPPALKACEAGDAKACTSAGMIYERGNGVEKDATKARILYNRGCSLGDNTACIMAKYLK